jgi:DNA-binding NarL/FixJ family response regulator
MGTAHHVLIVEDHPLFRDALMQAVRHALGEDTDIATSASVQSAQEQLNTHAFTLVCLDLNLSDGTGFEGLVRLRPALKTTPVAVVSATENEQAYATAQSLGAQAYLPKSLPLERLTEAIANIASGETWFPEGSDKSNRESGEKLASLTPAQLRVIQGLSEGLLNKQIAYEMNISEATVKAHMTAILRKLGANNRTQALLAYKEATLAAGSD